MAERNRRKAAHKEPGKQEHRQIQMGAPSEIEMPDTLDDSLPEGGWVNRMMLRNFEHLIGYTSTSAEFVAACAG